MNNELEFPIQMLHSRKLKATPTRTKLLKEIHAYGSAMPYSLICRKFKNADRVTLYRTIEKLVEKGLIHRAFSNNKETYYALCNTKCTATTHYHNHIHFKCTQCKLVTCEHLNEEVEISLPDFVVDKISINVVGICKSCK